MSCSRLVEERASTSPGVRLLFEAPRRTGVPEFPAPKNARSLPRSGSTSPELRAPHASRRPLPLGLAQDPRIPHQAVRGLPCPRGAATRVLRPFGGLSAPAMVPCGATTAACGRFTALSHAAYAHGNRPSEPSPLVQPEPPLGSPCSPRVSRRLATGSQEDDATAPLSRPTLPRRQDREIPAELPGRARRPNRSDTDP